MRFGISAVAGNSLYKQFITFRVVNFDELVALNDHKSIAHLLVDYKGSIMLFETLDSASLMVQTLRSKFKHGEVTVVQHNNS